MLEERRRLQDENEHLRLKVEALEETRRNDGFDREKFYEGATWMGQQTVNETENAVKKVEQLRGDYKKKVADCANDAFMKERVTEWVMDSCDKITRDSKDAAQHLLENALKNKNASTKITNSSLYNPRA